MHSFPRSIVLRINSARILFQLTMLLANARFCSFFFLGTYTVQVIWHALWHAMRSHRRDRNLHICSVMYLLSPDVLQTEMRSSRDAPTICYVTGYRK